MKRRPLSLTARLTLLYTSVSFCVLLGMSALVLYATQRNFVQQDTDYLTEKFQVILGFAQAQEHPDLGRLLKALELSHKGLYAQLWQDGRVVHGSAELSPPQLHPVSAEEPMYWQAQGMQLRGIFLPFQPQSAAQPIAPNYQLMLAVDTSRKNHFVLRLTQTLVAFVLLATAASGLLAWLAARAGLRPLRIMRERAAQVSAQQLEPRMPVDAVPAEMSGLAESLNIMLSRLKSDFDRLQQLSADLAHELRTPINTLLTQSQVVLAHPRSNEEYLEALISNVEELQRFGRTIADLMFLANTERTNTLPHVETIHLQTQVQQLCEFYEALAETKNMRFEITGHAQIQGDRLMLRRALSNLIANALRYGAENTVIHINLAQAAQHVLLSISNTGPTISAEHLPKLFDRFYRVDKSRQRPESEGAGLGLAICQSIVQAHGGSISVGSQAGITRFDLQLPAVYRIAPLQSS